MPNSHILFTTIFKIVLINQTGIFWAGKNAKPSQGTLPPLILTNNIFKGPAHLVYWKTLNFNISASRQNIKNLISNFGSIHVGIMHAKFQAVSLTGVGGEWGDISKAQSLYKNSKPHPRLARKGLNIDKFSHFVAMAERSKGTLLRSKTWGWEFPCSHASNFCNLHCKKKSTRHPLSE